MAKTSKTRKHSGRKTIDTTFEDGIDYRTVYDEWTNYRDGRRNPGSDNTKKAPLDIDSGHWGKKDISYNNKIKKQTLIRNKKKAKKNAYKQNIYI